MKINVIYTESIDEYVIDKLDKTKLVWKPF